MAVFVGGFVLLLLLRSGTGSEPWHGAIGLCFPFLRVCRGTLGDSMVTVGSWTYSFRGFCLDVNVGYAFLFVLPILFSVNIDNVICAPHSLCPGLR